MYYCDEASNNLLRAMRSGSRGESFLMLNLGITCFEIGEEGIYVHFNMERGNPVPHVCLQFCLANRCLLSVYRDGSKLTNVNACTCGKDN